MIGHRFWNTKRFVVVGFLAPALAVYVAFYIVPIVYGVALSLFSWDGLSSPIFVRLDNFISLAQDPEFINAVAVNITVVVISLVTQLPLALFLAALLMSGTMGMRFFRILLFLPQVLSLVAVGMLWQQIFDPQGGLANGLLSMLHLGRSDWLGSTATALPSLLFVTSWVYFGFHMILQMAGMSAIPSELYQAAALETNSRLQTYLHVTLPLLRETLLLSTVMIITGSFSFLMGLFWVMTGGGPAHATELLGIYMYISAFKEGQIGYANAMLVLMLIFLAGIVGALVWFVSRERVEY